MYDWLYANNNLLIFRIIQYIAFYSNVNLTVNLMSPVMKVVCYVFVVSEDDNEIVMWLKSVNVDSQTVTTVSCIFD